MQGAYRPEVRYRAQPEDTESGAGVDGIAYRCGDGYLFYDQDDLPWWIVFSASAAASGGGQRGDILACSATQGEPVVIRTLAADIARDEADEAFRLHRPASYEEAAICSINPQGPNR